MNDLLRKLGCEDIQNTKARFSDSPDFYLEIAELALDKDTFDGLGEALQTQDTSAAFEAAHALKDVIANCGLTPMLRLIEQIVESLRSGKPDYPSLSVLYDKLLAQRDIAARIIAVSRGKINE